MEPDDSKDEVGVEEIKHIGQLIPDPQNARSHNERNIKQIVDSLQEVGAARSIVLDEDNIILAGNGVIEAAGIAGIENVRVVEADGNEIIAVKRRGLTPEQKRRLALWDNRAGELSTWNGDVLAEMYQEDPKVFDNMFSAGELEDIIGDLGEPVEDAGAQIDKAEELREKWGVETGQMWKLGEHRIICGDCTDRAVVERLMMGEKADMVSSDPPYNVAYSSRGSNKDNWGKIENDDMDEDEFYKWLLLVGKSFDSALKAGGAIYLCHGDTDRKSIPFIDLFGDLKWTRSATIIWAKQTASMGWQDYRSQHECLSYGWKNGTDHYFTEDRSQTTLWDINRDPQADYQHPTQKPVELFERAINNSSQSGEVVVDFFLGSGTTLIACERLNRKCRAIEISPAYVAVSIQRWVDTTGGEPELIN